MVVVDGRWYKHIIHILLRINCFSMLKIKACIIYRIKFHHIFQKTRFRFIFLNHNSEWQNFLLTRLSTAFFFHTKHKSRHYICLVYTVYIVNSGYVLTFKIPFNFSLKRLRDKVEHRTWTIFVWNESLCECKKFKREYSSSAL